MPAGTFQERLLLAAVAGVVAAVCSIPFALLGRIIGYFVGQRLLSEIEQEAPAGDVAPRQLQGVCELGPLIGGDEAD